MRSPAACLTTAWHWMLAVLGRPPTPMQLPPTWGAWSAKAVVSAKFAGTPSLRNKVLSFIATHEATAAACIEAALGESKPMNEFVAANLTDEE